MDAAVSPSAPALASMRSAPSLLRSLARAAVDPLIALALGAAYVALLLSTAHNLGYARDEGFYFSAASSYEAWFDLLFREPERAFERAAVDRHWSANHEHPALMKSLFALSHRFLYQEWRWFADQGTSYRFPGMVVSALAVAIGQTKPPRSSDLA